MEDLKLYTYEELTELFRWFDDKALPESIQLDRATYIPNLKDTLEKLKAQAEVGYENPKTQGPIFLLERLKSKLQETQN